MRFHITSLVTLLSASAVLAHAQRPPSTEVGGIVSFSSSSGAKVNGRNAGELSVIDTRLNAKLGSLRVAEGALSYGVSGQILSIDADARAPLPGSIAGASLDLSYSQAVLGDKRLIATVSPGVYGSGASASGAVFVAGQASPTFSWTAGLIWSLQSEYPVLPVFGFNWQFSPGWTATFGAPRTEVSYQVTPEFKASFGVSVGAGTFRTGDLARSSLIAKDLSDEWFDYREIRVGPAASFDLGDGITLALEGGLVVDRRFEFDDSDVTIRTNDAAYGAASVNWKW